MHLMVTPTNLGRSQDHGHFDLYLIRQIVLFQESSAVVSYVEYVRPTVPANRYTMQA